MLNSTDSIQDVVKLLRETKDPAEKAALIAELVLSELPDDIALTARKCIVLHWFDQFTITTLLQNSHLTPDEIRNIYEHIISLPFVEKLPWGFAVQDLTREGLLKRYISTQPALLKSAAYLAARGYEVSDNEAIAAEALFCHVIAGNQVASEKLLVRLIKLAHERGNTHYIENLQGLLEEAMRLPFIDSSINRLGTNLISLKNIAELYLDQREYEQADRPAELTKREIEVLRLLAMGLTNNQIAEQLIVSVKTVNIHVQSIYGKLGINSRNSAARYAIEHHISEL